jgi:hypothetical protein
MGLFSRAKGRLKGEIKKRLEGDISVTVTEGGQASILEPAGPETLPDPDVRPADRDSEPWYLDGELEGWEETNPED